MENKIKTLSVSWWFIDYGVFGKFTLFLIDFRDSLSTNLNIVSFDLDRYLVLKDPNFVKKGLEDFLRIDKELNMFYLKDSKKQMDLLSYYARQDNIKLMGRSEVELTPEIEKSLKEKMYNYMINKRGVFEEKAIEQVDKLFIIS